MTLEFRVLGPLAVRRDDEPVPVNSARQRALLGALLVDANRVVTTQDLAYRVWGDGTPPGARETLQSYVMRLRRTLGQGSEGSPVVTRPDGYLIEVADGALDLDRFETLVRQAKAAEDDPAARAKLLRDALAEWRGDALSDVPSDALHREVVPALREQRLAAVELRIDADLHLGQHQDVIAELTDLTARYPLRERFWAHRMLALYRSGRAAEALGCYESARKILADELGVDPGPELRELHAALLANDPALSTPDTTRKPKGRDDLPGDIPDFAGRADAVRRLVDLGRDATTVVISAIDGMAGVGKTTLAVHAAHQLAHRFPDGRLFIDLRGYTREGEPTEPAAALDVLLRAMDVPAGRIPSDPDERSALWRSELAGRRVLVVLDNASSASQVRPLLPGSATCLALITSRHRLADLDTSDTLSLDVLSPDEAFALFAGVIGADRAQADPAATADVLRLCGYLPLAIRIAAARLRTRSTWPVRTLADRLAESWRDELTVGDRSVTAALDLSYARLGDDERRLFSLLGRHPGVSFESCQVAALGGIGRPDAERLLDELVDTHLLQVAPTPGRYRFHDLVRQYARTATEVEEPVWRMAIGRLLDFYLELALRMAAHLNPDSRHTPTEPAPWPLPDVSDADRAIGWCETELDNLLAAVGYAATEGWGRHAWQLACALPWFFRRRGHTTDWITCLRIGADAADDDNDRANVLRELGIACYHGARFTEAVDVTEHALVLYRGTGDEPGEAAALNNLGNMYDQFDEVDKAVGYYRQALALRRRVHDLRGAAMSLMNLCRTFARIDSFAESLECGQHALDMYREVGDRRGESMTLNNLATLYFRMARLAEAQACGEQAVALNRAMLDRRNEASALDTLGLVHRQLGNYATAVDHHNQALALVREVGNHSIEAEIQANIEDAVRAAADAGKPLT